MYATRLSSLSIAGPYSIVILIDLAAYVTNDATDLIGLIEGEERSSAKIKQLLAFLFLIINYRPLFILIC